MHATLVAAHLTVTAWAWDVVASRLVFAWSLAFAVLNLCQTIYQLYLIRPYHTDPALERLYQTLFRPYKVERHVFRRLTAPELCTDQALHPGQAYAVSRMTRADRLAVLLCGRVSVTQGDALLHTIAPMEFLDSPEFESSRAEKDCRFEVNVVAQVASRCLYWSRAHLELFFAGEPHLANVMGVLVGSDVAGKVARMGAKVTGGDGAPLDLRLLSVASGVGGARAGGVGDPQRPPSSPLPPSLPSPLLRAALPHIGGAYGTAPPHRTPNKRPIAEHPLH